MKGVFSKYAKAVMNEPLWLGKPGVTVEVWTKWKQKDKKLGSLTVTVGGLRWLPNRGKKEMQRSWNRVREWFEGTG